MNDLITTESETHGPPWRPLVIAHRGASRAFPENTLDAFRGAAAAGADWVELDARLTADGVVVVHHDATVAPAATAPGARVTDRSVPVCGQRAGDLPAGVPTLAEVLALCEQPEVALGVNVELKDLPGEPGHDQAWPLVDAVGAVVRGARPGGGSLLVSSFDPTALERWRVLRPDVPVARLLVPDGTGALPPERVRRLVASAQRRGCAAIHPPDTMVDRAFVEQAHRAGLAVNVWTVNDVPRIGELVRWGVDGIITDVPDVARAVVDAVIG